jgi:orotate phosphoribosyltransferase
MIDLIPTSESVMNILAKTGAFRHGHFVYPSGKHASHYFQMPLAFRYYDNARILAVGLSRTFRVIKEISSRLPRVAVISPSPGGIPVAFGVREALSAEQIYWAEIEDGKRNFRQYVKSGEIYPAIIVDDIIRSGNAIAETVELVKSLGTEIIGIGSIVRFKGGPSEYDGVPVQSLLEYEYDLYDSFDELKAAEGITGEVAEEKVRF